MADRKFGFRTRALHAGGTPDAEHGARAVPIYQTTSFVFKDTPGRRQPLRAAEVRQHLLPDRQPHGGRVRGAHRLPGGRHRRGGHVLGHGRGVHHLRRADPGRATTSSPPPSSTAARSPSSTSPCAASAWTPRSSPGTDPADYAAAVRENTKAIFVEVVANPSSEVQDLAGLAKVAHDAGIPLVVDATLSTPYLVRPDRARRRHRDPLRHQVPRRARHHPRRRDRRKRPLQLGQRQVPAP